MAAKFLGQFLLERGSVNKQQLLAALEAQHASHPVLGEIAQARGMLDADQARRINERQRADDRSFGQIAQALGLLSAAQVDELLAEQKARRRMLGEIFVEQGTLTQQQLADALQAHQAEREDAVEALEIGVAAHALGDAAAGAISTCNRLFPRVLRGRCQFSNLVTEVAEVTACDVTAHVRIRAELPLTVAIGCDLDTMHNIAQAFLSIESQDCDEDLAVDALGELVNVLMGYVARIALGDNTQYRASPPDTTLSASDFVEQGERTLAIAMTSTLGPFVLLVHR